MSYNGWRNRATWLINVHFNPESRDDVRSIKDHVEEEVSKLEPWVKDLCEDDQIDWDELESHFAEDEFEQSCVWDLANRDQAKYLKSLNGAQYPQVMSSIKAEWLTNGYDYEAAISTVIGD